MDAQKELLETAQWAQEMADAVERLAGLRSSARRKSTSVVIAKLRGRAELLKLLLNGEQPKTVDTLHIARLLGDLIQASHWAEHSHLQRRGTATAITAKRRTVDALFWQLFGRKATDQEHEQATTDMVAYY